MTRQRLPNRRSAEIFDFEAMDLKFTGCIGRDHDGRILEIFIDMTQAALRNRARRLDRLNTNVARVLTAMSRGAALHLQFTSHGPYWQLTNGTRVDAEAARIVTRDPRVVAVDLALFQNFPAQTWRWANTEGEENA